MDKIKDVMVAVVVMLLSVMSTVAGAFAVLGVAFVVNTLVGIRADGGEFRFGKFARATSHLCTIYAVVMLVAVALTLTAEAETARTFAKFVSLFGVYFYTLNVLRNACVIYPDSRMLRFLHSVFTTEVFALLLSKFTFIREAKIKEIMDNEIMDNEKGTDKDAVENEKGAD